jgi:glycolate oxidase
VSLADILARELGSAKVLSGEERLLPYARDESPERKLYWPDAAVLAATAEEVALVLRLAAEHRVPVTPRGAGTGLTGGAVPVRGGIVLSTERMARIREIDGDDLVAVVEPGVVLGDLQNAVEAEGLFYPPDPASLASCSLGGNVAENAGGPRAFRYGVTREYVLGLEVALMGGEQLRLGRRTVKGVTGYDLVGAFVGSEGTFGVTTEITLKLLPRPAGVATLLAVFPSIAAAGDAVTLILRRGHLPRALELMDRTAIDHVRPRSPYPFPRDAGAVALIELDGDPEGLEAAAQRCADACAEKGALEVLAARDDADRRRLWQGRRICSTCLREAHTFKVAEDIAVPRGSIPEILRRIDDIARTYGLACATYGHAGDGNLHVNFLFDEPRDAPGVAARVDGARARLFAETVALGGTLSGEHGIGLSKMTFMTLEQSASLIAWQRRLKRLWDPADLLNPGKIFPS